MRGIVIGLILSAPIWAFLIAGGVAVKGMASRGELQVLNLGSEP